MEAARFIKQKFVIAELFSIPVKVDYRWFAVWALMSWLIAASIPDEVVTAYAGKLLLGAVASLVFFGSVLLHELAHAFVARSEGIEVMDIVLHPFGGVARLRHEASTPGADFRIAIAGPGASFLLAGVFFALWAISSGLGTSLLTPVLFILFLLNFLLAIFNVFPGYPLDGGRVLRAYLWSRGSSLAEATLLAGKFGKIIAAALVVFGVAVAIVNQDLFTGLWTVVVGLFLYDSAAGILRNVNSLEGLNVANVMEFAVTVDPDSTVMQFVDGVIPHFRKTVFPVVREGRFQGFLLLEDLKNSLPREKWAATKVSEVMRPVTEDQFIEADAPVSDAITILKKNGIGVLAVLDRRGGFAGLVERGRIRRRN